ncbi:MAG: peptidylprolyl isomerase [Frankiaceae bacterium]|nr:peptidylprolyl isomerase [Frankiaceae bacterium]
MASSKREKELARQRAERQAARSAAATQRSKQRRAVVASVVAVLLVAGAAIAVTVAVNGGEDAPTDVAAAASPSAVPSAEPTASVEPSASASTEPSLAPGDPGCEYVEGGAPASREVAAPPVTGVELKQVFDVTLATDRGDIVFTMDSAAAPCTANSLRSLADAGYFDDTPCHRLTTVGISVLQCGDPTGTGSGGPGYTFADENLEGATYPRGTVAMANAGADTNGSQFFLVYENSSLPPQYTPFGTITEGLDILDEVAAAGSDETNGSGDGKPVLPVQIQTLRAAPQV